MTNTIYKYDLDLFAEDQVTTIPFPEGKRLDFLTAEFQPDRGREIARVWCLVSDRESWDTDESLVLKAVITGGELPEDGDYVDTIMSASGALVLHIIEMG